MLKITWIVLAVFLSICSDANSGEDKSIPLFITMGENLSAYAGKYIGRIYAPHEEFTKGTPVNYLLAKFEVIAVKTPPVTAEAAMSWINISYSTDIKDSKILLGVNPNVVINTYSSDATARIIYYIYLRETNKFGDFSIVINRTKEAPENFIVLSNKIDVTSGNIDKFPRQLTPETLWHLATLPSPDMAKLWFEQAQPLLPQMPELLDGNSAGPFALYFGILRSRIDINAAINSLEQLDKLIKDKNANKKLSDEPIFSPDIMVGKI